MTEREIQAQLNQKLEELNSSISGGEDQAGKQRYCMSCKYQRVTSFGETTYCILKMSERTAVSACVLAYIDYKAKEKRS